MKEEEIIDKILKSDSVVDVFYDVNDYKAVYKNFIKLIHPDICKLPKAAEASEKLNKFKHELETGKVHNDDAGVVTYKLKTVTISGNKDLLKKSFDNYNTLCLLRMPPLKTSKSTFLLPGDLFLKLSLSLRYRIERFRYLHLEY